MTYDKDSHIKSVEDVKAFFHHLVDERKLNFHPDDDFADYISYKAKNPTFTEEEVEVYNRLMEEAFSICEVAERDICEIGFHELHGVIAIK
jgi:hypothetical protein